jgi:hypothetical protein
MARLAQGSTQQEEKFTKSRDFFHNRRFCIFIFKNQWGLYGGDLNGSLPIFYKRYFKKLTSAHGRPIFPKKSLDLRGSDTLIRQLCRRAI